MCSSTNGRGTVQLKQPSDVLNIDFISILDRYDEGVLITDDQGVLLYYNRTQSVIDGLRPEEVLGKKVTDIYQLSPDTSMVMLCLQSGTPMRNRTFFYKTINGKVANTIHSVFPIFDGGAVVGTICFVRDYKILKRTTPVVSVPDLRKKMDNGTRYTFGDILGKNDELSHSIHIAREAANSTSPIMIIGETGTGKELFAQSIHNQSRRSSQGFVAINCAAIPEELLEGIIFGTVKGAFTGALNRPGVLERANGATLFLDELLSMPINLQAKLLRVLQEKKVSRIGSDKEIDLDIKIISSINGSPREAITDKKLRMDLYYRLGVVMVKIPPLRQRVDDIELLVNHFILRFNRTMGTSVKRVSEGVRHLFKHYGWPGNIRELEHLLEGAMNIIGYNETIEQRHFSAAFESMEGFDGHGDVPVISPVQSFPEVESVQAKYNRETTLSGLNLTKEQNSLEREAVKNALTTHGGNVSAASRDLEISRQLLHYKMKKHGFNRAQFTKKL